jgi:hypothetical protein
MAVVAVLTTVVGPVLDHHFAERQASHGHVFLDNVQPEHVHSVDDGHGHAVSDVVGVGIVATGDSDATGLTVDNVVPMPAIRPGDGDNALRFIGMVADDDPPSGLTGPALMRPPIA